MNSTTRRPQPATIMKTILPLLLLLAIPAAAKADLAIYNFTGVQTLIGNGNEITVRPVGVLLWDVDTGQAWQLARFTLAGQRRFVVVNQSDAQLFTGFGRSNRTFTAVYQPSTNTTSFTFGLNANLKIRPGRNVTLPRTARNTSHTLIPFGAGGLFHLFGPASGTYTFAPVTSQAANARGLSLEAAIAEWRARYTSAGFVETQ